MIDERELWACAGRLMRQYGTAAWLAAVKRAEDLLDEGDEAGNAVFLAIASRIRQMEDLAASGAVH